MYSLPAPFANLQEKLRGGKKKQTIIYERRDARKRVDEIQFYLYYT